MDNLSEKLEELRKILAQHREEKEKIEAIKKSFAELGFHQTLPEKPIT